MLATKVCTMCKLTLPIVEFSLKNGKPGHKPIVRSRCKSCVNYIGRTKYHPRRKAGLCIPPAARTINCIASSNKTCIKCNISKSLSDFHHTCRDPNKLWHWQPYCKLCDAKYHRDRVAAGYKRPKPDLALRLYQCKSKSVKDGIFNNNLPFKLTVANLRDLIRRQTVDGKLLCAATGVELDYESRGLPLSPSIDRINNNLGYIIENIRITSLIYNLARRKWSDESTIEALKAISKAMDL